MSDEETGLLLHYMPLCVRSSTVNEWERKFCASIIAQTRKGRRPTAKQIPIMRRIVDDFRDAMLSVTDDERADARE